MHILKLIAMIAAVVALSACGKIHTGHVGVRTAWDGKVSTQLESEGFYTSFTSHVDEFSAKEIAVNLDNLTPKAKDNLSLAELDVSVYYRVNSQAIRELVVKRTGMSAPYKDEVAGTVMLPAFALVESVAKDRIADVVSKIDSLVIHTQRDVVAAESLKEIQSALNATDPGVFVITRVVVRAVKTDASIEQSIRNVVAKEKELETAKLNVQVQVANAEAVKATALTLTPQYLQHEYNQVLMKFAEKGGTVILDGSAAPKIVNLPAVPAAK